MPAIEPSRPEPLPVDTGLQRSGLLIALFALDSACRALLITLMPQQAYLVLGSALAVSILYLLMSLIGLAVNLAVPQLLHMLARRWLMSTGTLGYFLSAALLMVATPAAVAASLVLQTVASAMLDVVLNLYMLERIDRRDMHKVEPRRLLYAGSTFIIGPWLGVALHYRVMENLTYLAVMVLAVVYLLLFWYFRFSDGPREVGTPARLLPPPQPWIFIGRFAAQPRLLLAWTLAVGRNGWWLMYFVYTPILVATWGYDAETAGLVTSIGLAPLLLVQVWARIGAVVGLRLLLVTGYALTGLTTSLTGILAGAPAAGVVLLCLAGFFATVIDGAGNVPFLKAVRAHERAAMTSVYMTFRHVASLVHPGLFALVLTALPVSSVFVTGGIVMLATATLARLLPRRL